jgi:hypothetical protein
MNQYQYKETKQVPALLKKEISTERVNINNGMVELTLDGQKVVVPTAEAFDRLLKKVAMLENKLYSADNKINRIGRANG